MIFSAPDAAAIPSTVHTAPVSELAAALFGWTVGPNFIDATNGPLWKNLHRIISPALTSRAVRDYMPFIISEGAALNARLGSAAAQRDPIDLGYTVGYFAFEVTQRVLHGERLDGETMERLYSDGRTFMGTVGDAAYRSPTPLHSWWLRRQTVPRLRNRIESTIKDILERTEARMIRQRDQGLLQKDASRPIVERMMIDAVLSGKGLDHNLRRVIIEKYDAAPHPCDDHSACPRGSFCASSSIYFTRSLIVSDCG